MSRWHPTEDLIDQGRAARVAGKPLIANPYDTPMGDKIAEHRMLSWMLGWDQQDRWIREGGETAVDPENERV